MRRDDTAARSPRRSRLLVLALLAAGELVGCKRDEPPTAPPVAVPAASSAARELGAALYEEKRYADAERVLREVAGRSDAVAQDFVNVACDLMREIFALRADQVDQIPALFREIDRLCAEAMRRDDKLASACYVRAIAWKRWGSPPEPERVRTLFEREVLLAPDDGYGRMHLGETLETVELPDLAVPHYEKIGALGREFTGDAYMPSIYHLGQILIRRRKGDDVVRGRGLMAEHKRLHDEEVRLQQEKSNEQFILDTTVGQFGKVTVAALRPDLAQVAGRAAPIAWETAVRVLADAGELRSIDLGDVDGDRRTDLVAAGTRGVWIALQKEGRNFDEARLASGDFDHVVVAELDFREEGDDAPGHRARGTILAFGKSGARLFFAQETGWFSDDREVLPALAGVTDVAPVDFDHDGMLDLLLATGDGVKLLRNRGPELDEGLKVVVGPLRFDDATATASLTGVHADWVAIEDFDHDQDVDLLVGGAGAPTLLFSSLRRGRFERFDPARSGLPGSMATKPLLCDFDHDGIADLLTTGADASLCRGRGDDTFEPPQKRAPLPERAGPAGLGDVDLDGEQDLAAVAADGKLGLATGVGVARAASEPARPASAIPLPGDATAAGVPLVDDVDLDGALDVVARADAGAWFVPGRRDAAPPRALLLLRGRKDNRFATGTVVEVRAGANYERRFVSRPAQLFSFPRGGLDPIVRLWWPDGVVQYPLQSTSPEDMQPLLPPGAPPRLQLPVDPRAEVRVVVVQKKGPPGSCPFLYSWDGTKYVFVTDVLGGTPLGLPIDEKSFVPPGHDELVRLTSAELAPVDGEYRVQLTEELREVTYLDRAQLWVVDHQAGAELHPEERFTFPPWPPKRIHAMADIRPLVRAVDQDGVDWSDALARIDDRPAVPFKPIGECFRGIATRSTLELTLPDAARTAKRVRLLMTGWLQWGDASVNLAAAKNGIVEFLPPVLSVPDATAKSGWRDCGPPVGFPAGKTKTMVLDVTAMLNRADPRLRVTTTLELYWDAIRVALDDGDAPFTVTKIEPKSARLSFRGFSRPTPRRADQPQRFDWEQLEGSARWNQHPGLLTRYGDVVPLITAIDDRFVILSAGDAIDLRFDASTTPRKPGLARTYLLFLDGWAKDGDPNTMDSQSVEPLPFHGMTGYPYGPTEHYPDDDAHADYRAQWNTRPGRRLIETLVVPPAAVSDR